MCVSTCTMMEALSTMVVLVKCIQGMHKVFKKYRLNRTIVTNICYSSAHASAELLGCV